MSNQRSHRITTTDGVTIGGTCMALGRQWFLHGAMGDGDIDWQALLPHLTDHLKCHLPSMRGRGLRGDHPDLSLGWVIDDYLAYLGNIGEPTGLVGWSGGANHALAVAAQSDAVDAVASFEPVANSLKDEQEPAAFGESLAGMGELAGEGNLTAAMRAFAGFTSTTKISPWPRTPATSRPRDATSRTSTKDTDRGSCDPRQPEVSPRRRQGRSLRTRFSQKDATRSWATMRSASPSGPTKSVIVPSKSCSETSRAPAQGSHA